MDPPHFCPSCFAEIPASACAACGEHIAAPNERAYAVKLVQALGHPLTEVRMRAIIALGLRKDITAATALVDCALCHPVDVLEGLEIVKTLQAMAGEGPAVLALAHLARKHPAHAVRQAAADFVTVNSYLGTKHGS